MDRDDERTRYGRGEAVAQMKRSPSKPMLLPLLAAALFVNVFMAHPGFAQQRPPAAIHISDAFARATAPGATSGAVYLTIENTGAAPEKLVKVFSPTAASVEIHQMQLENGIMKMHGADGMEIKPGGRLLLEPGGYHVMLSGLKAPLKSGARFPLTLTFDRSGPIDILVVVEAMDAGAKRRSGAN